MLDGAIVPAAGALVATTSNGTGIVVVRGEDAFGNRATWDLAGNLTVGNAGVAALSVAGGGEVRSATASIGAKSSSDATVTVSGSGALWANSGDVDLGRGGANETAKLTINALGRVEIGGELDVFQTGTLELLGGTLAVDHLDPAGGEIDFFGGRIETTLITGNLVNDGGTLAPLSVPGGADLTGNYTQNSGSLEVEIGGVTPGTEYDQLVVTGSASLAGGLSVVLANGFEPMLGDSFEVLVSGGLAGEFDQLFGTELGDGLVLTPIYDTPAGSVTLLVEVALPGDYNLDGVVDAADYTVWRDRVGSAAGTLPSDVDGGVIGPSQYATWVANFGASLPIVETTAGVPEPSTLLGIACLFGGSVVAWRRANVRA
ncbi:MAG: hypothetical protein AAF823_16350 [Planctomycetota bacterium]